MSLVSLLSNPFVLDLSLEQNLAFSSASTSFQYLQIFITSLLVAKVNSQLFNCSPPDSFFLDYPQYLGERLFKASLNLHMVFQKWPNFPTVVLLLPLVTQLLLITSKLT